jgi:membrane protein DedA with SNARE-associated domain
MAVIPVRGSFWATAFALFTIIRVVGTAFAPALLAHAPVVLIITSPFLAHLVLTAPLLSAALYFPVAIAVSIIHCWVGYAFGRAFGQTALEWLETHTPLSQRRMALLQRWLDRSAPVVLFAFPGPIPATLAGAGGIGPLKFYSLMITAQITWVTACYLLGASLLDSIETVRRFVADHVILLTVLFTAAVIGRQLVSRFRSGTRN